MTPTRRFDGPETGTVTTWAGNGNVTVSSRLGRSYNRSPETSV
ncbi:hypothetical protein [Streptomyces sp. SID12501]|nr:hypothetical protein [Streptomyces sp. SID12501]